MDLAIPKAAHNDGMTTCPRCHGTGRVVITLAEITKMIRTQKGHTQEQVADHLKMSTAAISDLENKSLLPLQMLGLNKLSGYYGLSPANLLLLQERTQAAEAPPKGVFAAPLAQQSAPAAAPPSMQFEPNGPNPDYVEPVDDEPVDEDPGTDGNNFGTAEAPAQPEPLPAAVARIGRGAKAK